MYKRNIRSEISDSLKDSPVTMLCGARQTGKSTLVQSLEGKSYKPQYITFDDLTQVEAAKSDPMGFVAALQNQVILDEVQHVPEIFSAIKYYVDKDRRPGRFLLTGSANVLLLPKLSESLAGRMEIKTLWPLSQQEIGASNRDLVTELFDQKLPKKLPEFSRKELEEKIVTGGYPESIKREGKRRHAWFTSYVRTILERDIKELADISDLSRFSRLLSLLAARSATVLNLSDVGNSVNIPYTTLLRYFGFLQATYLCLLIQPWTSNLGLRLVKSPKILLNDTGLLCSLLGFDSARFSKEPYTFGMVLETFVGMELKKLIEQSATSAELFHFRTQTKKEVDFVIERNDGQLVGIEVKSSATIRADDFSGLKLLAGSVKTKFNLGIILYSGEKAVPFGDNLFAVPLSLLWA
jgi:uncharacterized protein